MKKMLINYIIAAGIACTPAAYAGSTGKCPDVPEERAERDLVLANAVNNGHYQLSGNYCIPLPKRQDYDICESAKEADSDKNNKVSSLEAKIFLEEACEAAKSKK